MKNLTNILTMPFGAIKNYSEYLKEYKEFKYNLVKAPFSESFKKTISEAYTTTFESYQAISSEIIGYGGLGLAIYEAAQKEYLLAGIIGAGGIAIKLLSTSDLKKLTHSLKRVNKSLIKALSQDKDGEDL